MVHLIEVIGFFSPKSESNFPGNGYSNKMTETATIKSNCLPQRVNLLRCVKTNAEVCDFLSRLAQIVATSYGHILDPLRHHCS